MFRQFTYLCFFILIGQYSIAQNDYNYGDFNVRNFSTNEYKGVAQNWDIIQSNDDFIIIANNSGILHFDGTVWTKIKLKNEEGARSLTKDKNGDIFVGGNNEFGKLYYDKNGVISYQKLSNALDSIDIGEIWYTIPVNGNINFISTEKIYSYSENGQIKITAFPKGMINMKSIRFEDKIISYVKNDSSGNCIIYDGNSLKEIGNSSSFIIRFFFKSNNINYVIDKSGVIKELIEKNNSYKLSDIGLSLDAPEDLNIFSIAINKSFIAVGTSGRGIFLFDKKGIFIRSFKEDEGLINLQIRELYFDHNNNLWSCNDNGISLIDLSSPITKFDGNNGITSTTEDLYFSDKATYLATRSDLFKEELINNKKHFNNTGIFNMEVFQIKDFKFSDGIIKTLVISNDGIYELSNGENILIGKIWAWDLSQSTSNPDRIWVGLDGDGITSLLYKNGEIKIERDFYKGTSGEVRKVIEFENKVFYAVKNKGVHILDTTKSQDQNVIKGLIPHDTKNGGQYQQFTINVFQNKLFVGTDNGLYTIENDKLVPFSDEFNLINLKIHRIFNDNDSKLWLVLIRNNDQPDESTEIGYIEFTPNGQSYISYPFKAVSKEVIQAVNKDMDGIVWFAGLKEIYMYNPETKVNFTDSFKTYISSVLISDSIFISYVDFATDYNNQIKYNSNTVTFNFTTPSYVGGISNRYSHYLEGIDTKWTEWDNESEATFQRLQEGHYTFHVKAKNYYGIESQEAEFKFTILPPWYRTWWAYIIYFIATVIFIYIIIKLSIRRVKEQNEKLEKIVEERTAKVELQKHEIEEKNRDIVDSIKYAKRIQNTILPTNERLNSILDNYFIIYRPKDIVSGDFYWADDLDGKSYFSAIDCTGHGVPGAFVSIVGFNGLKRTVNEFKHRQPAKILDKLTDIVIETFSASESHLKDGMDMSLCSLDYKTLKLEFAGANNPLILIRNGELIEVKGNKQPIGDFERRVPFTNHEIQLEKGDNIYLFTDGYADQFGGPKGKKFKLKTLKNLLLEMSTLPINMQKSKLEIAFNEWKGNIEQLDDVCLIGIKI